MVLADPEREWSLSELAEASGASAPTVGREVERATSAGLLDVRNVGRSKLISANTKSEYFEPLAELLIRAFGPRRRIADALEAIEGIEDAYIFGSWAARYRGVKGRGHHDVDLLIIGEPNRVEIYEAIEPVERALRTPVDVTFRTAVEWDHEQDPFVATVKQRELVSVLPGKSADGR